MKREMGRHSHAPNVIICAALFFTPLVLFGQLSSHSNAEIPPKETWRAEASASQDELVPAENAIDGNRSTRWGSPATDPNYLIIDLGKTVTVCGVTILWEAAYASEYSIMTSENKTTWQTSYFTDRGDGATDEIYFRPVPARYIKILGTRRATGWGYSIYEVDVNGISKRPLITIRGESASDPYNLLDGQLNTTWESGDGLPCSVTVDLRKERPFNGLRVDWGDHYATEFALSVSTDGKKWEKVGEVKEGSGMFDLLLCPKTMARLLKLDFESSVNNLPIQIREITMRGPDETLSPLALYQIAAQKSKPGLYPDHLRKRQVYWTLVGMPDGRNESLLDEYGNVEPMASSSSIMPFIFLRGNLLTAFDASKLTQAMDGEYLPLPSVTWVLSNLKLAVEAIARGSYGRSATFVRYTITNTSPETCEGKLFLAIRPLQINPVWQYGGLSPIRTMEITNAPEGPTVRVNGKDLYVSLDSADGFGVRPFENGDIARDLLRGKLPHAQTLADSSGRLSAALAYNFHLQPGQSKSIVLAIPFFDAKDELREFISRDRTRMPNANAFFDRIMKEMHSFWQGEINRVVFSLPDTNVVNTFMAQIGYILINRDSVCIQPGSRNYKRSWIRDGSLTSAALLRIGRPDVVRRFLDWYAERITPEGLVPPVLNNDGTVNLGFGSNLEYDSQGEFVFAMMEFYRFTRDKEFLRKHYEKIKRALRFMSQLRTKTLAPDYMKDMQAHERFVGILPPSYSHEGYSPPVHSYWDDFFALKGWKDGKAAAETLGDTVTASWAEEQYQMLRASVKSSLEKTMEYKKIDFIPGCAEKGDYDPTSTTIAFSPCDEQDILPYDAQRKMYTTYSREVAARTRSDYRGGFTPYEIRNITSLVRLGMKDEALFLLDYILTCRRPANWNHLAEVVLSDERMGSYIGDMPHTWVGSGYISAVRGMVVQEEKGKLVLLAGTPERWLRNGNGIELANLPTYFGNLNLKVRSVGAVLTINIGEGCNPPEGFEVRWPITGKPKDVFVDGNAWANFDEEGCRMPEKTRNVTAKW